MDKIILVIFLVINFLPSVFTGKLSTNSIIHNSTQEIICRKVRGADFSQGEELLSTTRKEIGKILTREFEYQDRKRAQKMTNFLIDVLKRSPDINVNNIIIPILNIATKLSLNNIEEFEDNMFAVESLFETIYKDYGVELEEDFMEFVKLAYDLSGQGDKSEDFRNNLQAIGESVAEKLKEAELKLNPYLPKLTKLARNYSNDIGGDFRKNMSAIGDFAVKELHSEGVDVKFALDELLEPAVQFAVVKSTYANPKVFQESVRRLKNYISDLSKENVYQSNLTKLVINEVAGLVNEAKKSHLPFKMPVYEEFFTSLSSVKDIILEIGNEVDGLAYTTKKILDISLSISEKTPEYFRNNNITIRFFVKALNDKGLSLDKVLIPALKMAKQAAPITFSLAFRKNLGDKEGLPYLVNKLSLNLGPEEIEEIILTEVKKAAEKAGKNDRGFRESLQEIINRYR